MHLFVQRSTHDINESTCEACLLICRWTIRTFTYWNDKGVPHLSFMEYMRTAYDIFTKPLYEVVQKNYERHGRVYG
ncbi:unnamed protein product, partial [Ixodes persulcatus]